MKNLFLACLLVGSLVGCSDDSGSKASNTGGSSGSGATLDKAEFGAACMTSADCTGPTNYCAAPPMATKFCTMNMPSCDMAATTCPEGWPCLDLNVFGIPAIVCDRR